MKIENLTNRVLTIITGIVLLILVGIHVNVNIFHYTSRMDADLASEALITTEIADNSFDTPDTWVSSTGDKLVSAPNIGAVFYKITGNMNLSIGIACSLFMMILIGLMIVYFRQLEFGWYEIFTVLIVLFSVFNVESELQSALFLWADYYIFYFISLYLMLIFYNKGLKEGKLSIWIWAISLLLATINGMEAIHASVFCYLPLLGVEIVRQLWSVIRKKTFEWHLLALFFCTAVISVGIPMFSAAYGTDSGRNIRRAGEKFVTEVWPAMGSIVYFGVVPAVVWCLCAFAVIGYLLALINIYKKTVKSDNNVDEDNNIILWGTLVPVAVITMVVLALTFTVREVAPRYFFPEFFILATGVGLFMKLVYRQYIAKIKVSALVAVIVVILGIMAGRYYYTELIAGDNSSNSDEMKIAEWMQDKGYEYGYTIFDNANTITVISNNAVKIRAVNNMKDMEGCKWLSDVTWYPPTKSTDGATVYLVSESAKFDFDAFLKERNPVIVDSCEIGRYMVYVLDHDYTVWVD